MHIFIGFCLISLIFLINPYLAFAEFTFTLPKNSYIATEEIEANVLLILQNQANKTYYLEGSFKEENSNSYFGLIWNDTEWVKYTASNFTTLKQITTNEEGKWEGIIKSRIDKENNSYSGTGNYIFQIRRFTTAGSASWSDNSISININDTSTPEPSTNTSSPSPTSTTINTFQFTDSPKEVNSNQSFKIKISLTLTNNPNTNFYIKGAFKKTDASNYFGLTKVDSNWIKNGSPYSSQYKIFTDSNGYWSGEVELQPEVLDSGYEGESDYLLKIARYTNSGSGPIWSNEEKIHIKAIASDNAEEIESISLEGLKKELITPSPTTNRTPLPSIPEEVYSLEKYVASRSSLFATVAGQSVLVTNQSPSKNNFVKPLLITSGSIIIILTIGWYLRTLGNKDRI